MLMFEATSGKPIMALLRPGKRPSGKEITYVRRVIGRIRMHWPNVKIVVRGDSHFCGEHVLALLEELSCDYILGLAINSRLAATVLPDIEVTTGAELTRIIADAGYRGHGAPAPYDLRIYTAGQKRRMTDAVKRIMRRRSAVEPEIGNLKQDHRMRRCHLKGSTGDAINACAGRCRLQLQTPADVARPYCVHCVDIGPAQLARSTRQLAPTHAQREPSTFSGLSSVYFTADERIAAFAEAFPAPQQCAFADRMAEGRLLHESFAGSLRLRWCLSQASPGNGQRGSLTHDPAIRPLSKLVVNLVQIDIGLHRVTIHVQ